MRHMVLPVEVTSFSGEQKSEGTRFAPRAILRKQTCFMQKEVCYEAAFVNAVCELLKERG